MPVRVASHCVSTEPPMRIVHVSPSYAPCVGGAERLLQAVSERLVERGHTVTVLTFDSASQRDFTSLRGAGLPREETLNGVHVVRVSPVQGPVNQAIQWWLRQRGGWRSASLLLGGDFWPWTLPSGLGTVGPLSRMRADVVSSINWYFGASSWTCLPRALQRSPRVAIPVLHIGQEWAQREVYARMFARCDAAIACTSAERDFMQARGARNVTVAGCGVEPARYQRRDGARIRAAFGIGDGPVVGFVGRQDIAKGVPTLIDAMQAVWASVPNAVLVLAGQRAHRHRAVSERLDALAGEWRRKVVLIDDFSDTDAPSVMDAFDVLTLPSVEEAFGLVMLEAWMCGKPVIGADIASTRCIIDAGVDGLLVKPFDAADLARKILELLADPGKRARFGAHGQAKVLDRFTWTAVTDQWEAAFRAAIG